jgi:3-hydroxypropanoate dehydrogenase
MPTRVVLDDTAERLLFRHARTHSAWQNRAVDDDLLHRVYDLMKYGATAANTCPLRVIFVKSPDAKARLKPALDKGNADKTMAAPVTAIFAYDLEFYNNLPKLFPHAAARSWYVGNDPLIKDTAFRNGTLQAAYFMLAARGLGLDCGPMSGFNADMVKKEFFADQNVMPNFLCNLGYGDPTKLYPRSPRLNFDEVAKIL